MFNKTLLLQSKALEDGTYRMVVGSWVDSGKYKNFGFITGEYEAGSLEPTKFEGANILEFHFDRVYVGSGVNKPSLGYNPFYVVFDKLLPSDSFAMTIDGNRYVFDLSPLSSGPLYEASYLFDAEEGDELEFKLELVYN